MAERHNLNQMSQSPPMLDQLRCPENSDDGHVNHRNHWVLVRLGRDR